MIPKRVRNVVGVCWAALLLLLGSAVAEQNPPPQNDDVARLMKTGTMFHLQATKSRSRVQAAALLEKAVEQFSKAAQIRPDYFTAQAVCADCQFQLARIQHDM